MKKTLALLICLAMLFTALSVNVFAVENTAKVTVVADATKDSKAGFAVKLTGFTSLKGVDLKIEGTGLTFEDTVTATGLETLLSKDTNYTVNGNVIHIVELTDGLNTADVTIKATANLAADATAPKITVTACKLAKSGEALYVAGTDYTFNKEAVVAPKETIVKPEPIEVNAETTIAQPEDGYFIPNGCVYDAEGTSIAKKGDGSFDVKSGAKYYKFPIPANGIMTFGVSKSTVSEYPAKQFGNYVNNYDSNKEYGSLIIVGDWDKFVQVYQGKTGAFLSEILAKLYADYKNNKLEDKDYVKFTLNKDAPNETSILVYKVEQTKYMWKDTAKNILEYSVRVYNLVNNANYTAVAYNVAKDGSSNPDFSAVIKSEKYTATN